MKQITIIVTEETVTAKCGNTTISGNSWSDLEAEVASLCMEISRDLAVDAADPEELEEAEEIFGFLTNKN